MDTYCTKLFFSTIFVVWDHIYYMFTISCSKLKQNDRRKIFYNINFFEKENQNNFFVDNFFEKESIIFLLLIFKLNNFLIFLRLQPHEQHLPLEFCIKWSSCNCRYRGGHTRTVITALLSVKNHKTLLLPGQSSTWHTQQGSQVFVYNHYDQL